MSIRAILLTQPVLDFITQIAEQHVSQGMDYSDIQLMAALQLALGNAHSIDPKDLHMGKATLTPTENGVVLETQ